MQFQDTTLQDNLNEQTFNASWRSTLGSIVIFLLFIAVLFLLAIAVTIRQGVPWWAIAVVAGFCGLIWLCGRPLVAGKPALSVGKDGLAFSGLKSESLLWRDIADVKEESVQGQAQIVVTMLARPNSAVKTSWWKGPANETRIPLGLIKIKDQAAAVEAVANGFAKYGGDRAARALQTREDIMKVVVDFEARLKKLTPVTWGLYAMVVLSIGVWLANIASGISPIKPLPGELLAWGANSASSVVQDREYWRLLTATFLHGGLIHLALNLLGLWAGGQQLNRLYGNFNFLLIYLGSALAGSALSLHFSAQQSVSVGASGAVFGVLGALFVSMYQHRKLMSSLTSKNALTSQGVFLAYALVLGFTQQGIDNAAHVGGLLAGCFLAWLLVEKVDTSATPARRNSTAITGVLLSGAVVTALVFTTPVPEVNHRQLFEFQAVFARIAPDIQAAEKSFRADAMALKNKKISESQLIEAIEVKHLPAYWRIERLLEPLNNPGSDSTAKNFVDIKRINSVTVKLLEVLVKSSQDYPGMDDPVADKQAEALSIEIRMLNAQLAERLKAAKPKP